MIVPHFLDNKISSPSIPPGDLRPSGFCALSHLMLCCEVFMGPQFWISRQSPNLYLFLSRNHPESERPLTCTAWWPRVCNCSATMSTFTKTPKPPALRTGRGQRSKDGGEGDPSIFPGKECVVRTDLLPASSRTSAVSKPLASSSFTTSSMITAPRNAKSSENSRTTPFTS